MNIFNGPCFISYQKYNNIQKQRRAVLHGRNEFSLCTMWLPLTRRQWHCTQLNCIYFCLFSFNPYNYFIKLKKQIQLSLPYKGNLSEATWWCNVRAKQRMWFFLVLVQFWIPVGPHRSPLSPGSSPPMPSMILEVLDLLCSHPTLSGKAAF